jgi:uncharacterized membrane protein
MALGIQFEQHWVTMGWAMEGLVLTWIGLRTRQSAPRHAALVVFAIALAHWFGWDLTAELSRGDGSAAFVPLLNRRALSCAVLVATLVASAWLYRREESGPRESGDDERSFAGSVLILSANLLALALLTLDISDYFTLQAERLGPVGSGEARRLENARQFSLSALWAIYGTMTLVVGARRGLRALRYVALFMLIGAAVKVFAFDLAYYAAPWHVPLVNHTFMAFAFVAFAFIFAARLYEHTSTLDENERAAIPVFILIANVLLIVALSGEASGYFDSKIAAGGGGEAGRLRDLWLAKQLSLSVIWATYGGVMLVYGRLRRKRMLRLMALALLILTTLKVFFWDLSSLDGIYRIISSIVLGAILLAVSYLYQKTLQQQQRAANDAGD